MGPASAMPNFIAKINPEVCELLKNATSDSQRKKILKANNISRIPGYFETIRNPDARRHHIAKMLKMYFERPTH